MERQLTIGPKSSKKLSPLAEQRFKAQQKIYSKMAEKWPSQSPDCKLFGCWFYVL